MSLAQLAQVGGNTTTPTCIRSRRWCLTLNNYTENDIKNLTQFFNEYVIGREVGKNGTPHLQGYFENKSAVRFKTLKKEFARGHWEKPKGNKKQNFEYCIKEGNYISNMFVDRNAKLLKKYDGTVWRDWQQKIIDIINGAVNDRKIYWVIDFEGNNGKSFLAKYIFLKYNVIIAEGKKDNIFNQIKISIDEGKEPKIVLVDVPRSGNKYVNYGALESIKNGLIYSGKYEGGCCAFDSPHLIIFSNEEPDMESWSKDRYELIYI